MNTCSLIPRLPWFGTQTLKLCKRGEPGICSHVSSFMSREMCVGVSKNSEQEKKKTAKVVGNLLHVSIH